MSFQLIRNPETEINNLYKQHGTNDQCYASEIVDIPNNNSCNGKYKCSHFICNSTLKKNQPNTFNRKTDSRDTTLLFLYIVLFIVQ